MPNKGKFIGGQDNLFVPDAPTIGTATAGNTQVSVAFTAPSDVGGDAVTLYGASVFLAGATINYRVSVGTGTLSTGGSGNVYFIDGIPTKELSLVKGFTYVFDQSDSSNSGHPLRFKDNGGSSYSTGVTASGTAGSASATVTLVLATDASEPSSYYCTSHGNGMGNTISLIEASASTDPLGAAQAGTTGSSSPITVTGLSNGTSYIAQVWAINDYGNGPLSAATSSFSPAAPRGVSGGGYDGSTSNVIQYITISSTGNATDFGDLTVARLHGAGAASSTRGVFTGGTFGGTTIDYVTVSSTGNATDFGDPANERTSGHGAFNNDTRAVIAGGHNSSTNALEYITIASTGNGTNFGNLSGQTTQNTAFSSTTRGIIAGGRHGGNRVDVIEYVTTASTGNVTDFGNLSAAKDATPSGSSNSTIGVIAGGESGSSSRVDDIEQITIASTGNATDFGNLLSASKNGNSGNCSSSTRGIFMGGEASSRQNVIQYVTFGSAGNATDFGDLLAATDRSSTLSNTNGGIA